MGTTPPTSTRVQIGGTNDPTFIVKCGDNFYVTQSVATYVRADAMSETERADIESLAAVFETAKKAGQTCEAVKLPKQNNVMAFQQTSRR